MARVYLVEKIVGHKLKGNTHLYKVKWVGFPLDEATYEPAENFVDKSILAKYQKKHNLVKESAPIKKKSAPLLKKGSTKKQHVTLVVKKEASKKKLISKTKSASIPNKQNLLKDLVGKRNIKQIVAVFKSNGKVNYTAKFEGKGDQEYLLSNAQLQASASKKTILNFFENLIQQ